MGQSPISAVTLLETFQSGEEPSLLLVQERIEKHDGGLGFLLLLIHRFGQEMTGRDLFLPRLSALGRIKVKALMFATMDVSAFATSSRSA